MLARLWGWVPWDRLLAICADIVLFPLRLWYRGAQGIPSPRPHAGRYLGRGPRTPGHRVRFWHPDLNPERQRLDGYAAGLDIWALETDAGTTDPSRSERSLRQSATEASFTLICRRQRLGHNSWLHGARHDGQADVAVWVSPQDLEALGLPHGGTVQLHTASTTLQVRARPVVEVRRGLVVMPHGFPEANVNALLPSGCEMLEPLSGQHRMTGIPVRLTPVR